jgi:hypothetical protein
VQSLASQYIYTLVVANNTIAAISDNAYGPHPILATVRPLTLVFGDRFAQDATELTKRLSARPAAS